MYTCRVPPKAEPTVEANGPSTDARGPHLALTVCPAPKHDGNAVFAGVAVGMNRRGQERIVQHQPEILALVAAFLPRPRAKASNSDCFMRSGRVADNRMTLPPAIA